jgi:hypothetical protein
MKNEHFFKGAFTSSISTDRDKHHWPNKMPTKRRYEKEEADQPEISAVSSQGERE